jgi:hypothetical protein
MEGRIYICKGAMSPRTFPDLSGIFIGEIIQIPPICIVHTTLHWFTVNKAG